MSPHISSPLLTSKQVAELTRHTTRTVHNWIKTGKLVPIRVSHKNLFFPADVEAFLRGGQADGKQVA